MRLNGGLLGGWATLRMTTRSCEKSGAAVYQNSQFISPEICFSLFHFSSSIHRNFSLILSIPIASLDASPLDSINGYHTATGCIQSFIQYRVWHQLAQCVLIATWSTPYLCFPRHPLILRLAFAELQTIYAPGGSLVHILEISPQAVL